MVSWGLIWVKIIMVDTKAKQPESGDLCGDITEFGVVEGSPFYNFGVLAMFRT